LGNAGGEHAGGAAALMRGFLRRWGGQFDFHPSWTARNQRAIYGLCGADRHFAGREHGD
jgi:hypothetical protein